MITTNVKELWETIEWLNAQLEATKSPGPLMVLRAELVNLIKVGQYIRAIKTYRDATKVSLLEAKNYCEAIRTEVLDGKHGEYNREHYAYLTQWRNQETTLAQWGR